jgi:hypothetical protein
MTTERYEFRDPPRSVLVIFPVDGGQPFVAMPGDEVFCGVDGMAYTYNLSDTAPKFRDVRTQFALATAENSVQLASADGQTDMDDGETVTFPMPTIVLD